MSSSPPYLADIKRLLFETGRRYMWRYAISFVLLAVVSATTAATAWLMKNVINDVFIAKSESALFFVSVAVLVIYVGRGLASFGQGVMLARIGNDIVAEGQKKLSAKLLESDVGTILTRTSSEIVQKQMMAADSVRALLQTLITGLGRDVLSLLGLVAVMVMQEPLMSSVVLLALPVAAFFVVNLSQKLRSVMGRQMEIGVSIADQLRQITQGFRMVKAFGVEDLMQQRLSHSIDQIRKIANKIAILTARTQPIVETLAGFAVGGVIFYGGWRVIAQGATPGEFFSFITALLLAYDPARRIAAVRVQIEQNLLGLRVYFEMMDEAPSHDDAEGAPPLAFKAGDIRFEGVDFAYEAGTPVLRGLTCHVEPGKTTAFVGSSGSGKTTLMSLLLRFWRPQAGRILVDGQDIGGVTAKSLRAVTAYVGQDAYLFDGSVAENIRIGKPDASEGEVIAAAQAAEADGFIRALPQGYDTPVGELASRLSGGQKQRIAIARAFLRNAPVLLLDEPTAALDAKSEEAIRTTLAALAEGRTTILIAHRLATVVGADKIIVIDAGAVAESGSHATLIAKQGLYASLWRLQTGEG